MAIFSLLEKLGWRRKPPVTPPTNTEENEDLVDSNKYEINYRQQLEHMKKTIVADLFSICRQDSKPEYTVKNQEFIDYIGMFLYTTSLNRLSFNSKDPVPNTGSKEILFRYKPIISETACSSLNKKYTSINIDAVLTIPEYNNSQYQEIIKVWEHSGVLQECIISALLKTRSWHTYTESRSFRYIQSYVRSRTGSPDCVEQQSINDVGYYSFWINRETESVFVSVCLSIERS